MRAYSNAWAAIPGGVSQQQVTQYFPWHMRLADKPSSCCQVLTRHSSSCRDRCDVATAAHDVGPRMPVWLTHSIQTQPCGGYRDLRRTQALRLIDRTSLEGLQGSGTRSLYRERHTTHTSTHARNTFVQLHTRAREQAKHRPHMQGAVPLVWYGLSSTCLVSVSDGSRAHNALIDYKGYTRTQSCGHRRL
jgi:hypothetical protein